MSFSIELDGPRHGPQPGQADALVMLLHGLGADGNDLIGLAPVFSQILPDAAFVSPHAPFPCDMAPFGRQWFSLQNREPDAILAGVRAAAPHLDAFIDQELERYGLDDSRLVLLGFSQGCMMALHVALRRARTCAAILGYSGMLVGTDSLVDEIKSRPPVLLVHGEADEIVAFSAMAAAETALVGNGVLVQSHACPGLGHGIDETGLRLGAAMLRQHLAPAPKSGDHAP